MQTTVINIKDAPDGWQTDSHYVYIGRYNSRYGVQKSRWHNPFKLTTDNTEQREQCCIQYTRYLLKNLHLPGYLDELKGKTLVCYCSPKLCHGHVLASLSDRTLWEDTWSPSGMFQTLDFDVDSLGKAILYAVDGIRRAYHQHDLIKAEYEAAKKWENVLSVFPVNIPSTATKLRSFRLKCRTEYEKAQERRIHFGGRLAEAQSGENRMRRLIRDELAKWRYLYHHRMLENIA